MGKVKHSSGFLTRHQCPGLRPSSSRWFLLRTRSGRRDLSWKGRDLHGSPTSRLLEKGLQSSRAPLFKVPAAPLVFSWGVGTRQRLAGGACLAKAQPSMEPTNKCMAFKRVGNQSPGSRRQPTSISQQGDVGCRWKASPVGSCPSQETSPCPMVIWTWFGPSSRVRAMAHSPVRPPLP